MAAEKAKKGCLIVGWAFVALVILAVIFGPDEESPAGQSAGAEIAETGKAISDPKAAARIFYINAMSAMRPCDRMAGKAGELMSNLTNGTTVYEAYTAADQAEAACRQSYSAVSDVTIPAGLSSENQKKAEETLEMCRNAMIARQTGFATIKEVLDGDARPSKVSEATEKAERAKGGILVCAAYLAEIATLHKLDIDELNKAIF